MPTKKNTHGPRPPDPDDMTANVVSMSDVEAKPVVWLWEPYIPAGAITLLDGDANEGKSTISIDFAARISRGDVMPPHTARDTNESGDTLLIQAEDDPERTTKPRLLAAGADVSKVHLLRTVGSGEDQRFVQLPMDLALIEQVIIDRKISLVVIDVLSAFLEQGTSMNDDAAMRRVFNPMGDIAQRTEAAFLVLRHFNKKEGVRSLYRGSGSVAIAGAARAAFAVASNPEDQGEKVFCAVKHNLGPRPHSLTYTIQACQDTARIVWGGQTKLTAADVLKQPEKTSGGQKVQAAMEIIEAILDAGPCLQNEVWSACKEAGISFSSYKRARSKLGVLSENTRFQGQWLLSLPSSNGHYHEECQVEW